MSEENTLVLEDAICIATGLHPRRATLEASNSPFLAQIWGLVGKPKLDDMKVVVA